MVLMNSVIILFLPLPDSRFSINSQLQALDYGLANSLITKFAHGATPAILKLFNLEQIITGRRRVARGAGRGSGDSDCRNFGPGTVNRVNRGFVGVAV